MVRIGDVSKQSRKHITTACIPCRETKVKCDGAKPSCKNCRGKRRDCHYRQRNDRRKVPVRVAIALLTKRVATLCQYIQDCGLNPPSMDEKEQDTLDDILQAYGLDGTGFPETPVATPLAKESLSNHNHKLARDEKTLGSAIELEETGWSRSQRLILSTQQNLDKTLQTTDGDREPENERASHLVWPPSNESSQLLPHIEGADQGSYPPQPPPNVDLSDAEIDEEMTNQLSCRLGKLQFTQDGQLRYSGSTSNLHLLDVLVSVTLPVPNLAEREATEILETAGLNAHIDESFEKHLIELYFTWQDPSLHLVDYDQFWKARAQHDDDGVISPYYSQLLVDAMCALGAAYEPKYHPELVTFPRSLSQFFGDRAKVLLKGEIENPSLATVQALVLLSNHEAASTRDTRGWLYSGMAMRLAFDLGLHVDMTPYVERGIIPADECLTRRMIYWGVYLNEQFWGFYLGRSIHSPVVGVTVRKPGVDGPRTATRWKPHGGFSNSAQSITNPLSSIFHQWVTLYDIVLPLTDVLYGRSEISKHTLQELNENTVARLIDWKNTLPAELDFDGIEDSKQCLPHILTLK